MPLSFVHDAIDDIPEQYRDLYTEREGKFVLTGITGIKTQDDIDRVNGGLTKERTDHAETKEKLAAWLNLGKELEEVTGLLDKIPELEVAAKGNKEEMEQRIEEFVESRIGGRLAPYERENKKLKADLESQGTELVQLRAERKQRFIHDDLRAAADKAKVLGAAMPDVLLLADAVFDRDDSGAILTKENHFGVSVGLSAEHFFGEMQEKRPHWWPLSEGGDSKGSGGGTKFGDNPWTEKHWNSTAQTAYVRQHGEEKAAEAAKAAGSFVGAIRPTVKAV